MKSREDVGGAVRGMPVEIIGIRSRFKTLLRRRSGRKWMPHCSREDETADTDNGESVVRVTISGGDQNGRNDRNVPVVWSVGNLWM
jgi:hypothetical protein